MDHPTHPRACAVCGVDISGMRRDARVCKAQACRNASKRTLPRLWTTAEARQCIVAEDGARCPSTATRRLATEEPMCDKHDARANRHGDPTAVKLRRRPHGEVQELLRQAAAVTGNDCFLMPGPDGGRLSVSYCGRAMTAARAVWAIAHGDPGDRHVLHTCHRGDEGCTSIRHLYLGDHGQNMVDMVEADHSPRGERNGRHKLTADQVREARVRFAAREATQKQLAEEYGVRQSTVSDAISGKRWGWLAD